MNITSQTLTQIMAAVEGHCGPGTIRPMGRGSALATEALRTGSLALDLATGIDGYPVGRVIELFGPEGSGKTTLALHAMAEVQRSGGTCAFIDADHTLNLDYARGIGVAPGEALIAQPDTAESAFEIIELLARSGRVPLIVVDSVGGLVSTDELDGGDDDRARGRVFAKALRKLTAVAHRTRTTLLFLNPMQPERPARAPFAPAVGVNALKFYTSMRVWLRRVGDVRRGDQLLGAQVHATVVKNKHAAPFATAEFEIRWGEGVDRLGELFDLGARLDVLRCAGKHLSFGEVPLGHSRVHVRETLGASPTLEAEIREAIVTAAREHGGCL
ncbi:DNA recombination/repair protein RecA [Pendulispora brunnea]|uniref:Protein RecA n=1 Tax=Pendulispora brunnea TaxID=2905690 RepID=A0ABZ2KLW7_9BACT